jgi:hypothetical protein
MLMQEIEEWKNYNSMFGCELDDEHFEMFFDDVKPNWPEWIHSYLAKQIYELQLCVEGLIEDIEELNGQKNQKIEKEDRPRYGCAC